MPFVATFFACETQDFASLLADTIVVIDGKLHDGMLSKAKLRRKILRLTSMDMLFIGVMKCLSLPRFLFVRRKILRLYRLTPLFLFMGSYMMICTANQSRDAKFCVSQAIIRYLLG